MSKKKKSLKTTNFLLLQETYLRQENSSITDRMFPADPKGTIIHEGIIWEPKS